MKKQNKTQQPGNRNRHIDSLSIEALKYQKSILKYIIYMLTN